MTMPEIRRMDDPDACPECETNSDMHFILRTENSGLSICAGCGRLQVQVEKIEDGYVVNYYYWYPPEAITADYNDDDDQGDGQ